MTTPFPLSFRRPVHLVTMLALLVVAALAAPAPALAQADATVVYLVRHAERAEDGTNDPPLSEAGRARAELLGSMLRDARLTRIHTTDFKRTRSTGAPVAQASGLEMELYDPRDLEGFARELRASPGRHLVLGHSNTTPGLVAALGGDPWTPIDEMEYDRLYIVTLTDEGASTVLLRFGTLYGG
jgi:phosphohistidine phosphatase SixA